MHGVNFRSPILTQAKLFVYFVFVSSVMFCFVVGFLTCWTDVPSKWRGNGQEPEWPGFPLWSCPAFIGTCTCGQCDNRGRLGADGFEKDLQGTQHSHSPNEGVCMVVRHWETKPVVPVQPGVFGPKLKFLISKNMMIMVIWLMASKAPDKTCQHLTACWLFKIPYLVLHKPLSASNWQM